MKGFCFAINVVDSLSDTGTTGFFFMDLSLQYFCLAKLATSNKHENGNELGSMYGRLSKSWRREKQTEKIRRGFLLSWANGVS